MPRMSDYFSPQDRQKEAMKYIGKGFIIFYGGARGGGKSYLSHAVANIASVKYPGLRTIIVRETYPELEDVFISYQEERFPPDIFQYKYIPKDKVCVFENGSRLLYKALDSPRAARKIMGSQFQFMVLDEANNYDELTIRKLIGSLRNTNPDLDFKPTFMMTGNPGGISDLYFKTRFVNPDYKHWETGELKHKEKYVFVKAMVWDNKYIEQDYIDNLEMLNDSLKRAWLYGEWHTFEGQYFEEWNENHHIVEEFPIPDEWTKVAGIDIGYTKKHPCVCLFLAQNPDDGMVYVYDEYVSSTSTEQYIYDIKEMCDGTNVELIYADPSMWSENRKDRFDDESPAFMFTRSGLPVLPANNKRINGWRTIKQWLHWTARTPSKLKVFDRCSYLIQTLPMNKYSQNAITNYEDLDTRGPDDAADALRYALVSGFGYPFGGIEKKEELVGLTNEEAWASFRGIATDVGYKHHEWQPLPMADHRKEEEVHDFFTTKGYATY